MDLASSSLREEGLQLTIDSFFIYGNALLTSHLPSYPPLFSIPPRNLSSLSASLFETL